MAAEQIERWLAEVGSDATRRNAVVASGTGPRLWTRFRADHWFSELDYVIMSARATERCTSRATGNGGGTLAVSLRISDHRAIVTTLRARPQRATAAGGGADDAASFAPPPRDSASGLESLDPGALLLLKGRLLSV